ncbi:MAG: toxin-antitoxin system HicB family antitoxin [Microcystaceae cyanobacterium]
MTTLTIQLADDKHTHLQQLADIKGISVDQLIEEISSLVLSELKIYTRFKVMADQGDRAEGLRLLAKLDELSS